MPPQYYLLHSIFQLHGTEIVHISLVFQWIAIQVLKSERTNASKSVVWFVRACVPFRSREFVLDDHITLLRSAEPRSYQEGAVPTSYSKGD